MTQGTDQAPMERIHHRELEELRQLTVHRDLAAAAALHYCAEAGIAPPSWVVERIAQLLPKLLLREKADGRGRIGNRVAQYRRDQSDLERWDAVEAIRRMREKTKHDADLRRQHGETPENSRAMYHHQRMRTWLRHGTFECAGRYLSGRDARVGADAIKASYRRCGRRSGTGSFPDRYYVFDAGFLAKLGFPDCNHRKSGTKLLPVYNLT